MMKKISKLILVNLLLIILLTSCNTQQSTITTEEKRVKAVIIEKYRHGLPTSNNYVKVEYENLTGELENNYLYDNAKIGDYTYVRVRIEHEKGKLDTWYIYGQYPDDYKTLITK
jgi:hypothetical protein